MLKPGHLLEKDKVLNMQVSSRLENQKGHPCIQNKLEVHLIKKINNNNLRTSTAQEPQKRPADGG